MADKLIIVESPAKAATIKKFLGGNVKVLASMGHIRDLPKSKLAIDIENDFEFRRTDSLGLNLLEIKKLVSEKYILASDKKKGEHYE